MDIIDIQVVSVLLMSELLNTEYVCDRNLIKESYSGLLTINNMGLCPSTTTTQTMT
jgi:hypothetical protein